MPVWGYSEEIRSVRELRVSFAPKVLESILGDELDSAKTDTPVVLLYDDKVARCAVLLAEECQEPLGGDRLYGESLTTALTGALFTRRKVETQRANGLSPWQLRRAMEYFEAHMTQDISLDEMAKLAGLPSHSSLARLKFLSACRRISGSWTPGSNAHRNFCYVARNQLR